MFRPTCGATLVMAITEIYSYDILLVVCGAYGNSYTN